MIFIRRVFAALHHFMLSVGAWCAYRFSLAPDLKAYRNRLLSSDKTRGEGLKVTFLGVSNDRGKSGKIRQRVRDVESAPGPGHGPDQRRNPLANEKHSASPRQIRRRAG